MMTSINFPKQKTNEWRCFIIISKYYNAVDHDIWNETSGQYCWFHYNHMKKDDVMIPNNNVNIYYDYPLNGPYIFNYEAPNNEFFTCKNIIDIIAKQYYDIYQEEEQTAPDEEHNFIIRCSKCFTEKILNGVSNIITDKNQLENYEETTCSICLENYNNLKCSHTCPCGHIYHKNCIDEWFKNNDTCPLCRNNISKYLKCDDCDGITEYKFVGKVLPLDLRIKRGGFVNRNKTNGKYGIWGHDIEDLAIERINYDENKNLITLFIGS